MRGEAEDEEGGKGEGQLKGGAKGNENKVKLQRTTLRARPRPRCRDHARPLVQAPEVPSGPHAPSLPLAPTPTLWRGAGRGERRTRGRGAAKPLTHSAAGSTSILPLLSPRRPAPWSLLGLRSGGPSGEKRQSHKRPQREQTPRGGGESRGGSHALPPWDSSVRGRTEPGGPQTVGGLRVFPQMPIGGGVRGISPAWDLLPGGECGAQQGAPCWARARDAGLPSPHPANGPRVGRGSLWRRLQSRC